MNNPSEIASPSIAELEHLRGRLRRAERRARLAVACGLGACVVSALANVPLPRALAQAPGTTLASLAALAVIVIYGVTAAHQGASSFWALVVLLMTATLAFALPQPKIGDDDPPFDLARLRGLEKKL